MSFLGIISYPLYLYNLLINRLRVRASEGLNLVLEFWNKVGGTGIWLFSNQLSDPLSH